jgi:hypothetical protein
VLSLADVLGTDPSKVSCGSVSPRFEVRNVRRVRLLAQRQLSQCDPAVDANCRLVGVDIKLNVDAATQSGGGSSSAQVDTALVSRIQDTAAGPSFLVSLLTAASSSSFITAAGLSPATMDALQSSSLTITEQPVVVTPPSPSPRPQFSNTVTVAKVDVTDYVYPAIGAVGGFFLLVVVAACVCMCRDATKRNKKKKNPFKQEEYEEEQQEEPAMQVQMQHQHGYGGNDGRFVQVNPIRATYGANPAAGSVRFQY